MQFLSIKIINYVQQIIWILGIISSEKILASKDHTLVLVHVVSNEHFAVLLVY